MATTLILLGGIWLHYATINPSIMRTRAMGDAAQLEMNLQRWAAGNISEGKLSENDVKEIFPDGYTLVFGGGNPNKDFREMIGDIAQSSAPPVWPGVVSIVLGFIGAVYSFRTSRNKQAEHLLSPD